jgi:Flp pilus assembly pilin Flp
MWSQLQVGTVESDMDHTKQAVGRQTMRRIGGHTGEFLRDERAATAVEYGVLIAGIAAVIIATVLSVGGEVRDSLFQQVDTLLETLP